VVMIVACQVMDPGSIPGERIFFLTKGHHPVSLSLYLSISLSLSISLYLSISLSIRLSPRICRKKRNPGNRSRTSDLEISIVAIYSLPLCQLSYTRAYASTMVQTE
jgi:hypothetical protein